jgi:hypothetical protein
MKGRNTSEVEQPHAPGKKKTTSVLAHLPLICLTLAKEHISVKQESTAKNYCPVRYNLSIVGRLI